MFGVSAKKSVNMMKDRKLMGTYIENRPIVQPEDDMVAAEEMAMLAADMVALCTCGMGVHGVEGSSIF
eukprot:14276918-Ditylum_brightwellii.AAC.1